MTSSRWQRIHEIFNHALKLEPNERDGYLDQICAGDAQLRAELASLLAAHAPSGPLDQLSEGLTDALVASLRAGPHEGDRIGPYRIVQQIARGGMGAVFLAERADRQFEQRVALKFVRLGPFNDELLRRFATERQILAQLNHPNIARLLDGGITEQGLPYIVMEYVEGQPIDRYCDERRLTIDERLRLFRAVCDAVQYAHQNLVVHRDLKPSNIFVTEDESVKLLDFGIAKLLTGEVDPGTTATRTGQSWFTPEYASPEQVRGESITTATDTYALGVLLYGLLTGHRPYQVTTTSPREVERIVCESDPTRPSLAVATAAEIRIGQGETLRVTPEEISRARKTLPKRLQRRLAGDLDTIVLKALRKEPDRRYAAAGQLSEDIQRHLSGLPVRARPDTLSYRASKFVRRHRVGVAAAAVIALSLLAGIGGTAWQARRATEQARVAAEQRDRARIEAAKAAQISDFLIELFQTSDPEGERGGELTALQLLDQGTRRVEEELAGQPEVQADMMDVIGRVYRNLARYAEAEPLLTRALEIRRSLLGPFHPDVGESLSNLANLLGTRARYDEAERYLIEALDVYRAAYGPEHEEVASALTNLGSLYHHKGELDKAADLYREAIGLHEQIDTAGSHELANAINNLGGAMMQEGDLDAADSLHHRSLEIKRRLFDPEHPEIAASLNNLGGIRYRKADYGGAEPLFRESLQIRRHAYGPDHPMVAQSLNNLAAVLEKQGKLAEAEPLYRESLELKRKLVGNQHPTVATSLNNLGLLVQARGDLAEAERLLQESLDIRRKALGESHPAVAVALHNLGVLDQRLGQQRVAERLLREALRIRESSLPEDHPLIAENQSDLAGCLLSLGRHTEAEPLLLAAYPRLRDALGAADPATQTALRRLARLFETRGDSTRAAEYRSRLSEAGPAVAERES